MLKEVLVFCDDCPDRVACDTPENRCAVVKMVHQSTREQDLPAKVEDPEVLAQVQVLFQAPVYPAPARKPRRR